MRKIIKGKAYVTDHNIDTDQIIPAEYLTLSHTVPAERPLIAQHAFAGLPDTYTRFMKPGQVKSDYNIIIGGENFGCGSSRAQAPGAMNAAGVEVVIANYFARIFFRNSVNAALLIPVQTNENLLGKVITGDELDINLLTNTVHNLTRKETYTILPLGAIEPILEVGDVFEYAKLLK